MSAFLTIGEKRWPIDDVLSRVTLNDAVALKLQTGISIRALNACVLRIGGLAQGFSDPELWDDPDLLAGFRAWVWLVRRYAGEVLTVDEANDWPLADFQGVLDDSDAAESGDDADPNEAATEPSGADAAKPAPRRRTSRKTSTTSTKQS